jgi:hypothetical protein
MLFLERVHFDPHQLPVLSTSGFRYWLLFFDDYSRYFWIYLLRKKSDTFGAFNEFKAMVEKQFDKSILCLHDDKGGEFICIKWSTFFAQHGIRREHTVKASPQQNGGAAERLNRTLEELLVAMLNGARLSARFWGEGPNHLRLIIVRSTSSLIPPGTTPYEMTHKHKPDSNSEGVVIPLPFEPAVLPSSSLRWSSTASPSPHLRVFHRVQRQRASRLLARPTTLLQYQTSRRRRRQRLRPHTNRPPPMTTTTTSTRSLKRAWHADWDWMELLSCPPTSAHYSSGACARSTTTTTSTLSCPRPWSARSALPSTPKLLRLTQSPSCTAKPCAARNLSCV